MGETDRLLGGRHYRRRDQLKDAMVLLLGSSEHSLLHQLHEERALPQLQRLLQAALWSKRQARSEIWRLE